MTHILFRCDASLHIGSGHVMRCRTLARELRRRGAEITFLCRRQPGDLIKLLEQEFQVLSLPEQQPMPCVELAGRTLYAAWLGCSQQQDAADCLAALEQAGISSAQWLVVDHYGLDSGWEVAMREGLGSEPPPQLLVIDDLADRTHSCELLLDQNFFSEATERRYQGLVPQQCRQLLGPHYALLGPEYALLHPLVPPRTELRRVLVFFGGVDLANLTGRALEALMDPALAQLAVDVVLGLQCPHREAVQTLVAKRPYTTLHGPQPSLAGLIARADLAIGAGGATTWERACLGLPSVVLPIAANQLPFSESLAAAGLIHLLLDRADLLSELGTIEPHLLAQSKNCKGITDGRGAQRLATALLGVERPLGLRQVCSADENLLLRWANDPQVRERSFSTESITAEAHHNWFKAGLKRADRLQFIACDSRGCPLGQVRFDRQADAVVTPIAVIDISVDCSAQGNGVRGELLRLALGALETTWGNAVVAQADVLGSNQASRALFVRSGFSPVPPPVSCCDSLPLPPGCITLLSDESSWLNNYLPELLIALQQRGHAVRWIHEPAQLAPGDVCLLLSCGRLLSAEQLAMHRHNLVVHESDLPLGQGWSPMTWQILEGVSSIPITLFEAVSDLDAGPIHLQTSFILNGTELVNEWRQLQAEATINLCLQWLYNYQVLINSAYTQTGEATYYRRRRPADSQLDPERTLAEQFDLLRVVDNERYPAFFEWRGRRYQLQIEPVADFLAAQGDPA